MAVVVGVSYTLNSISTQFCIRVKVNVEQASYDGNLLMALAMLPGFIVVLQWEESPYNWTNFTQATLIMIIITLGVVFSSIAYKHGDAGPNEAIRSSSTLI